MALSFDTLGSEDIVMEEPPTRRRKRRMPDDDDDDDAAAADREPRAKTTSPARREPPSSAQSASTASTAPPPPPPPADTGYWQYLNRPSHPSPLGPTLTASSSSELGILKMARLGVQSGKMPQQLPPNYDPTLPVCSNCTTQTTPLWRRDESGSVLCNACALFQKMKGRPRPMSLKTDVIKQRNRVRKDKNAAEGDELDPAAKAKPKGKGKATQAPALKPHLATGPSDAQAWGQGSAEDRGTSRSRNPLRYSRKSAPGGADAAAAAEATDDTGDGMEVDELEDEDDVDRSFNGYAAHNASLSPESSSASNETGDVGSVKRRRRRASEDVGDEAGVVPPPRAGAGQRRLSSANRRSSRSTSRARMPRSDSVDRVSAYAAVHPPGYAYPYAVPTSPAAGARWMVPPGASPYHHYYTLPPGAPPHPSYPAGYAPYAPWQPAPAQSPPGYPLVPAPAPFGTSALRMSSSVDPHVGAGGGQGYHSVRFAPASVAQAQSPTSAGSKSGEPTPASAPPPTALRSASVDRPAGLRIGLSEEDEERGRRRARVTLPPLRAMIDGSGSGESEQGSLPPRSGPPVSFEASAAAVVRRDASAQRSTVSSHEEPARALRAASIVSSASSDSLSRGRPPVPASTGQTYSPGQATTSTASLHRDSPRFSSTAFGSIEEEPKMAIDEADGPTYGGLGVDAASSRRGRSETRKGTLSRGGSGGSTLGGSGERTGQANGSPSHQHASPSAFAGASPNRAVAHLGAGRPPSGQARNVSGLSNDSEELAHLRTRVAELEIINGFMESRIGQLEERSRSTSRSGGGSSGRGSSSRGISRGRGRGSGPGGGLPTPTSSRERAARAAATLEGKIAAASSVVSGPSTSSSGGGADDSMVSEEAEQEDEAVFAAELQKHGIGNLDEGTRTAMLGLLRAKYGYRAGDLEPDPSEAA